MPQHSRQMYPTYIKLPEGDFDILLVDVIHTTRSFSPSLPSLNVVPDLSCSIHSFTTLAMKFAGVTLLLATASAVEAYTRLDKTNTVCILSQLEIFPR